MINLYSILVTVIAAIQTLPGLYKAGILDSKKLFNEKRMLIKEITKKFGDIVIKRTNTNLIIKGKENCDKVKNALFISNHQSLYDIPLLLSVIPQQIGFVAKKDLKKVPIVNKWITEMNGIFLDREDKKQSLIAVKEAIMKLKRGHNLVIFPEGTRSNGKEIKEFKKGSIAFAKRGGVPIIPIAIEGVYNIGRKKKPIVMVSFLNPVYINNKDNIKKVTNDIQKSIVDMVENSKQYIKKM